jgi:heat shock protein HtpX
MTALAGPSTWLLRGIRTFWGDRKDDWRNGPAAIAFGVFIVPVAGLLAFTGRIVSRHRELAADRAAAVLTGSPAGVAAALMQVADGLSAIPVADLRAVAPRDPFHVLPVREQRGVARLWATHPRLDARLRRLEHMEARLQG